MKSHEHNFLFIVLFRFLSVSASENCQISTGECHHVMDRPYLSYVVFILLLFHAGVSMYYLSLKPHTQSAFLLFFLFALSINTRIICHYLPYYDNKIYNICFSVIYNVTFLPSSASKEFYIFPKDKLT